MRNFRNQTTKNRHTGDRLEQIHGTYSALNNKAFFVSQKGGVWLPWTPENNTSSKDAVLEEEKKIEHKELSPGQKCKIQQIFLKKS